MKKCSRLISVAKKKSLFLRIYDYFAKLASRRENNHSELINCK